MANDQMPLEYQFRGNGVRGKYAKAIRKNGYSVTVHHADGSATTRHVSPQEVIEQDRQRELLKTFNQSTAPDLTQAAQDIKALLDQLATDYPNESPYVHAGRAIDTIKQNPTLTQRLGNALQASGTAAVEKAIAAITDNPAVSVIIAGVKGFIAAE